MELQTGYIHVIMFFFNVIVQMTERERHHQLALALFRSAAVLQNPDLLSKILGPRVTPTSASAASMSKSWRRVVDAQDVDRRCTKRQSFEDFLKNYTPLRAHINLRGCISNEYQVGALMWWIHTSRSLVTLNVSDNNMDRHMTELTRILVGAKLRTLVLERCELGKDGATALAKALQSGMAVTTLDLSRNRLNAEAGKALAEALNVNAVLTDLNLSMNNLVVETDYIKATEVEGDSKEVGAKVVYQGREMTVSEGIDSDGELTVADFSGVLALADALKVNGVMTKLVLSGNDIKDEGAIAIDEGLKSNKSLKELSLIDCGIGPGGGKALADGLSVNAVLTSLSLARNDLTNYGRDMSGIQALAAALSSGSAVLTSLDLSSSNLAGETGSINSMEVEGDSKEEGAKVVYQGREMTVTRVNWDASELKMADFSGVLALANALKANTVLTTLDLSWNTLNAEAGKALAEALKVNGVLTHLDLSYNWIDAEAGKALAKALEVNGVLTSLDVRGNYLQNEGKKVLRDAVEGREGFRLFLPSF